MSSNKKGSKTERTVINYHNFSREGFEDYLNELKRRNKKNNKLDFLIGRLVQ